MRIPGFIFLCLPLFSQAEEFSFDLSRYEKPAYELGGYIELFAAHAELKTDSALYNLLPDSTEPFTDNNIYSTQLQLDGLYRFNKSQLRFLYSAETQHTDIASNQNDSLFYELFYSNNYFENLTVDLGKRVQKWGKGYAWNPVGFIERKKDPNDPELSREGYVMLSGDYVRSFNQNLKTLSIMPVIIPVTDDINADFSNIEETNFAAKVYVLYRDIDIDFMFLNEGSRAARAGFDFSSNLSSSFEIHGEFVYIKDENINLLDSSNQIITETKNVTQSLLGFRYLTESEITWIGEYYHNGAGYTEEQLKTFFTLAASDFETNPLLLPLAQQAGQSGYTNINPGKDYLYISAAKKEPFDFVYFNLALNSIINLHDQSYSLTPELSYTGLNNSEMRFRMSFLQGKTFSEFGEKLNDWKFEFRFRYYF